MTMQTLLRPRQQDSRAPQNAPRQAMPAEPASDHGGTWTSERVAQLKSLIEAGLTCSRIAAEIGVSRNAVIGKMSRLGLSRRRRAAPVPEEKPRRAALGTRNLTRILARAQILTELAPAAAGSGDTVAILDGRGRSLFELTAGQCRWPINDPGTPDFCFCGSARVEGLPYCVGHVRRAYRSTAGRA